MKASTRGRPPIGALAGEDVIVQRIVDLADAGLGSEKIAVELACEGRRSRHGGALFPAQIRRVLARERLRREADDAGARFVAALESGTLEPSDLADLPIGVMLAGLDDEALEARLRSLGVVLARIDDEDARNEAAAKLGRSLVGAFGLETGVALIQVVMIAMVEILIERAQPGP